MSASTKIFSKMECMTHLFKKCKVDEGKLMVRKDLPCPDGGVLPDENEESDRFPDGRLRPAVPRRGAPLSSFAVDLQKTASERELGAYVEFSGAGLVVTRIFSDSGLLKQWNTMNPEAAVLVGDEIVEINGIREFTELSKIFKEQQTFRLLVQRHVETSALTVEVQKTASVSSLGLDVEDAEDENQLLVTGISCSFQSCLMAEWNREHPEAVVLPGDKIVEVNGIRGIPRDLLNAIKTDKNLTLVLHREVSEAFESFDLSEDA